MLVVASRQWQESNGGKKRSAYGNRSSSQDSGPGSFQWCLMVSDGVCWCLLKSPVRPSNASSRPSEPPGLLLDGGLVDWWTGGLVGWWAHTPARCCSCTLHTLHTLHAACARRLHTLLLPRLARTRLYCTPWWLSPVGRRWGQEGPWASWVALAPLGRFLGPPAGSAGFLALGRGGGGSHANE